MQIIHPYFPKAVRLYFFDYDTDSTTYQGWKYLEGTKKETQEINEILKNGLFRVGSIVEYIINLSTDIFFLSILNFNIFTPNLI